MWWTLLLAVVYRGNFLDMRDEHLCSLVRHDGESRQEQNEHSAEYTQRLKKLTPLNRRVMRQPPQPPHNGLLGHPLPSCDGVCNHLAECSGALIRLHNYLSTDRQYLNIIQQFKWYVNTSLGIWYTCSNVIT